MTARARILIDTAVAIRNRHKTPKAASSNRSNRNCQELEFTLTLAESATSNYLIATVKGVSLIPAIQEPRPAMVFHQSPIANHQSQGLF